MSTALTNFAIYIWKHKTVCVCVCVQYSLTQSHTHFTTQITKDIHTIAQT